MKGRARVLDATPIFDALATEDSVTQQAHPSARCSVPLIRGNLVGDPWRRSTVPRVAPGAVPTVELHALGAWVSTRQ